MNFVFYKVDNEIFIKLWSMWLIYILQARYNIIYVKQNNSKIELWFEENSRYKETGRTVSKIDLNHRISHRMIGT